MVCCGGALSKDNVVTMLLMIMISIPVPYKIVAIKQKMTRVSKMNISQT